MSERFLTKIEINLPVTITISRKKILPKLVDFFIDTDGIGGCTYSIPSQPPILKGFWLKSEEAVDRADFQNNELVQNLLNEEIIISDENEPNKVYFNNSIKNKPQLENHLESSGIHKKDLILKIWDNCRRKKVKDDIVWIYACYDIEHANVELKRVIETIRNFIETEAGEDLAWIVYSSVCFTDK